MPHSTLAKRRSWERSYRRARKAKDQQEKASLESIVLNSIKAHEGEFDGPSLYYYLEGAYPFTQIEKTIDDLRGNGRNGLIEFRRCDAGLKLFLRPIPPLPGKP